MIEHARDSRRGCEHEARNWRPSSRGLIFGLLMVLTLIAAPAFAGGLLVTWDAGSEADLAGYRIYYGTEPSLYTETVDVGKVTSHLLQNLTEGLTYYLVVTAYDLAGNESLPSVEVSATVTAAEIYIELLAGGIQVRWSALSGADSYAVYASNDPYFTPQSPVAQGSSTQYLDAVLYKTTPFARYYIVQALSGGTVIHTFERIGAFSRGLKRGQNLVSMPLVPHDNSISKVLGSQLNGAANAGGADKVLYWNGRDYEVSWLVEGTGTSYDGKWMTQAGDQESPLKLDPDRSFWVILRPNAPDTILTFTGKVSSEPNRVIDLVQGTNHIGSCYPVPVTLVASELAADGVAVGGSSSGKADKLMRWLGSRYEVAWLVGGTGTSWDGTWFNESGAAPTTIRFEPGTGYVLWIRGSNASTVWTYPNPQP